MEAGDGHARALPLSCSFDPPTLTDNTALRTVTLSPHLNLPAPDSCEEVRIYGVDINTQDNLLAPI